MKERIIIDLTLQAASLIKKEYMEQAKEKILEWAEEFDSLFPVDWDTISIYYESTLSVFAEDRITEWMALSETEKKQAQTNLQHHAQKLWDTLAGVHFDESGCLEEPWYIFSSGTNREKIWAWFEERYHIHCSELRTKKLHKYLCFVLSRREIQEICGNSQILNLSGFLPIRYEKNSPDYWYMLEQYIGRPVVSVQPTGRDGWREIFVLTAEGDLVNGKPRLKGDFEYLKSVLMDIFFESYNDECEVFDYYTFDISEEDYKKLLDWMKETYAYEVSD